jgi:hypothetical protein
VLRERIRRRLFLNTRTLSAWSGSEDLCVMTGVLSSRFGPPYEQRVRIEWSEHSIIILGLSAALPA